MTEQELREKIYDIMARVLDDTFFPCTRDSILKRMTNALIVANIGDVSELETKYKQEKNLREFAEAFHNEKCAEYELLNYQFEKMKHRAEVAEKIAEEACEIVFCEAIDNEEWDEVIRNYKETKEKYSDEFGITDEMLYDYLHEKAEKELALQ